MILPQTDDDWQAAADGAAWLLAVDAVRFYDQTDILGLALHVNVARCQSVIRLARDQDIYPLPLDEIVDGFLRSYHAYAEAATRG